MAREVWRLTAKEASHDLPDITEVPIYSIWLCEHCDRYFRPEVAEGGGRWWKRIHWWNLHEQWLIRRSLQQMRCAHDEED